MASTSCTGKVQIFADSPVRACGRPAVGNYTAGCVHEHVTTAPLCAECRDGRARLGMLCWECFQADGHDCPMSERQEVA